MSEFLGTILIVAVLWFGGTLILGQECNHRCSYIHLLYGYLV